MEITFYIAGGIAVAATIMMLTRLNAIHALLYLVVSLLAVAVVFYTLGAPFAAALEVIIYAGAVMVLFVFAIMLLNIGRAATRAERQFLKPGIWIGPCILAAVLIAEFIYLVDHGTVGRHVPLLIGPIEVGISLFGTYLLGVELASILLLGGIVGAYHLGWRWQAPESGPARELPPRSAEQASSQLTGARP